VARTSVRRRKAGTRRPRAASDTRRISKPTLHKAIFDTSPDGIFLIDGETLVVLECNSAACALLDYPPADLIGRHIADFEAEDSRAQIQARARDGLRAGGLEFDSRYRTRSGRVFEVHVWAKPLTLDGRVVFYSIFRDITSAKRAEERLRLQCAALNASADAIMITDAEAMIQWVNPAFGALTGYTAEEALGRNPRDLLKSDRHSGPFYLEFWRTLRAGHPWHGEMVNRRKDGTLYTEEQTVTPILDDTQQITHYVAIKRDVTERIELEGRFLHAQKLEVVGQLASGIAHDFNNLLTVINGTAELARGSIANDHPLAADLREIQGAGERAAALTRQLLAFSRQQILETCVFDVDDVIRSMHSLLSRLIGADVELVVLPGATGNVKADPGQIEQVITNLAVNARDAMPGGGRLTIETESMCLDAAGSAQTASSAPPGWYVCLSVSDTGTGMTAEIRSRIFEPFFTTKDIGQGTGLGLSTVYGIVKQSHGFLSVYSEVGQGTTFKVYLPVVQDSGAPLPLVPEEPLAVARGTILVVEDETAVRDLTVRILGRAGYNVVEASTGEAAAHLAQGHGLPPVDLLLTDVVMPGVGGRALGEQLTALWPGLRVLYMSGYTSDGVVRRGILESQMPFLRKPFSAAMLLRKVQEVLESGRASG
jgi:PAS domain S-box-containing protein